MIRKPKRINTRNIDGYKEACYSVRKRDKHTCQMPNCESKKNTQVHHIRRFSDNGYGRLNQENMILLCKQCHFKVTGSEDLYAPMLIRIVGENIAKNNSR